MKIAHLYVANWKMYKTRPEVVDFIQEFLPQLKRRPGREIVICPSFPLLETLGNGLKKGGIKGKMVQIGAQNVHSELSGAFTGEVSTDQIVELGCKYVILGHSERRAACETDEMVNKKAIAALRAGLQVIICVGESQMARKTGKTQAIVGQQVKNALATVSQKSLKKVIFAYEPMWAIGTGKVPTLAEIEDVHQMIRQVSKVTRVLYGGSVNQKTIQSLLQSTEIQGFLVGSASLDPNSLADLVNFG